MVFRRKCLTYKKNKNVQCPSLRLRGREIHRQFSSRYNVLRSVHNNNNMKDTQMPKTAKNNIINARHGHRVVYYTV